MLNWEKLTQFKKILQNMYDGWKVVDKGYSTIKDISSGNFSLHKSFLNKLSNINPVVKNYYRIAEIIRYQSVIVKQSGNTLQKFRDDDDFSSSEKEYIGKVCLNLINESLKNVEELLMIVTGGVLRMTDDERLKAIDNIYHRVIDQFGFLQGFTSSTATLRLQRKSEKGEIILSKRISGY